MASKFHCRNLSDNWVVAVDDVYMEVPSRAEAMVARIAAVCPIDPSEIIEDRPARNGIIRPNLDPATRPQWAEAFYLIVNKTRLSYTLEAPSDFPLTTRVNALVAGVNAALAT